MFFGFNICEESLRSLTLLVSGLVPRLKPGARVVTWWGDPKVWDLRFKSPDPTKMAILTGSDLTCFPFCFCLTRFFSTHFCGSNLANWSAWTEDCARFFLRLGDPFPFSGPLTELLPALPPGKKMEVAWLHWCLWLQQLGVITMKPTNFLSFYVFFWCLTCISYIRN